MMAQLCQRLVPGARIASFGYPDIIGDVTRYIGDKAVTYRPDSEAICKRHGLKQHPIPDAHSFFEALGAKLDVFDIVKERGCEIPIDLNEPVCGDYRDYDYALDVGTAEHCFNIAQAMINMADMVKKDGLIFHENPFNWPNHGFYNLNPTFFTDFYEHNGFEIVECFLSGTGWLANPPRTKRFKFAEREATIFTVAKRCEIKPFKWPTQTKYKQLLG